LLNRAANEGALPSAVTKDTSAHDAWFRAKVQEALNDPRPAIPQKRVEAYFTKRRAAASRKKR
jgi:DNA-damage-inducible protein J